MINKIKIWFKNNVISCKHLNLVELQQEIKDYVKYQKMYERYIKHLKKGEIKNENIRK